MLRGQDVFEPLAHDLELSQLGSCGNHALHSSKRRLVDRLRRRRVRQSASEPLGEQEVEQRPCVLLDTPLVCIRIVERHGMRL